MLEKLLSLLVPSQASTSGEEGLSQATAILLAEAGMMDGAIGEDERQAILRLLGQRFSLSEDAAQAVFARAETAVKDGTELYSHSKIVKDALSYEERLDIIEMLWEVVYADGHLHDYEANLMRRLNRLLYVEDVDSGLARKRVMDRLGLS